MIDANMSKKGAKKLIDGYESGDPQVMDLCPNPLSGEWVDDPGEMEILEQIAEIAVELKPHKIEPVDDDNLLDIYETHFQEGFWETVLQKARNL